MRKNQRPELWGWAKKVKEATTRVGAEFGTILKADHIRVLVRSKFTVEVLSCLDSDDAHVLSALREVTMIITVHRVSLYGT